MTVLITGGTGFIGSHTVVALAEAGIDAVIVDNLSNSSPKVLERLKTITGKETAFYRGDIRDRDLLRRIFAEYPIEGVIHFAGLKAVGESVVKPLEYYDNNVSGSLILAQEMARAGVRHIIFSSSATVYGDPQTVPITEDMPVGGTTNPYGTSKLMVERILQDIQAAFADWSVVLLRYFNPIGAHQSGLIGEDPRGIPNNLLPYICQVAAGKLAQLSVFGNDYPTADGTGVRDYIHVCDLAAGHVRALQHTADKAGVHIYNLGTGQGYSVLEMVHAFESVSGKPLPHQICSRRAGDIAVCYADAAKARRELGWQAQYDLRQMLADAWRWQQQNPNGYGG